MYHVYILASLKDTTKGYIGMTADVETRLREHNQSRSTYSKQYAPWELRTRIGFADEKRARAFEAYLKSGSGFAFMKKRLL